MLFSISIPVYGQQQFIPTALKSIQAQSVDYELAVMDATPDNTIQEVLDQYAEIISYRRHASDDGQSEAIKEGWDHTSGDVVAWLCADDYYFPDTLQAVQEVFERHPETDIVYGDSVYVDADDRFKMYFPSIECDVSCLPVHDCIAQPSCFIRRSALDAIGGLNTGLHYIMDWDLWTRLYNHGAIFYYLHKPLSVTRIYPETKTNSMSLHRYREINQKLKQQASLFRRLKSLVGVLHFDLSENNRNVVMGGLVALMDLYIAVKRKLTPERSVTLYGLEKRTNKIADSCTISLPWYHSALPQSVTLTTLPNVQVVLRVDGECISCNSGAMEGMQVFTLPEKFQIVDRVTWHFRLHVSQPCRLVSFVIT